MLIALHVSDNHGFLEKLDPTAEVIIHSGDFLPSFSRGIRAIEIPRQQEWISTNKDRLAAWIGGRPFLYTPGNHDYVDPCPIMRGWGLDAWNLYEDGPRAVTPSIQAAGFPWVNHFTGEWNYEIGPSDMLTRARQIPPCEMLVAHGPIYGVLDRNAYGTRCGSLEIRHWLQNHEQPPLWYLHGHIHEARGYQPWSRGLRVSNAATIQRRIHL